MTRRVVTVVGARPQFIKAATVSRVIRRASRIAEKILHTGQHFDDNMSAAFFRDLDIPAPDFDLGIGGGSHGEMTGRMLEGIEHVLIAEKPDAVIVYGDTNSTLAGALAAIKLQIPVIHVEAGLRSFNMSMPEEINRVVVDRISSLLLCPTADAVENLAREGIGGAVRNVGDVMYDATLFARAVSASRSSILADLELVPGGFALATVHRADNTDSPDSLRAALNYIVRETDGHPVIMPVHPRTRAKLDLWDIRIPGISMIDPVGYFDMHQLLANARIVLTDSGGLQKEAYFHRVPCVTLRSETEWNETVANGWNRLWTSPDYAERRETDDFGDGNAAEKVVAEVQALLGLNNA